MSKTVEEVFSFGVWVRRRRKALDLTQAALAQQVGCAEITIRKLESDVFRPSPEVAQRLAHCLSIPTEIQEEFVRVARAERCVDHLHGPLVALDLDQPLMRHAATESKPLHNLPAQAAALIGREREITEVCSRIEQSAVRLLTLTGPGGIGKTRLSLAVAAEVVPSFPDGVFFVSLAAVVDPLLVPATIAQALGVQERAGMRLVEGIKTYVRDKKLLLIMDNFEHVLPARGIVSELLRASPALKVLITSRAVLHLYGEQHVPVPALTCPDPGVVCSPERLLQCEAIQLFIDRARAVKPDYPFTDATITTVAQICQRLEGLPLAIELAAARSRLFSPANILLRLEQALPFLKDSAVDRDARHQTLEHTIAWSYDLLDADEQVLFRRLAVFVGGWTLEAATAVCDLEGMPGLGMLDVFQALLDKSLLKETIAPGGEPRFSMLEMIREFALSQLALSGEVDVLGSRHAAYYQQLAEAAEPKLVGEESIACLDQLDLEYGNLRTALAWFKAEPQRAAAGVCLAATLCRFWELRGQFSEGRSMINSLLACSVDLPFEIRAKALEGSGVLAMHQCDYTQAKAFHAESLELWIALDDQLSIARSHMHLGMVLHRMGDVPQAKVHLDTALAMVTDSATTTEEAGDVFAQILSAHAVVACHHSDYDQAVRHFERALALSRSQGNLRNQAQILKFLGGIKNQLRQYGAAQSYFKQSLELHRVLRDYPREAITLYDLAVSEQETYQYDAAQTHFLAALKVHETTGNRREQVNVMLGLGILYHQLGAVEEAHTWLQRGLALSYEIEYAAGRAFVLANLGPVLRDMGDIKQAEAVLHEGIVLGQAQNNIVTLPYCLSELAMMYLEAGQASQALHYAFGAFALRRKNGMLAWAPTDIVTIAAAYLALEQHDLALTYVDEAMLLLTREGANQPEFPQRDYFRCYQVYAALERSDHARRALQLAYTIVREGVAKMNDVILRQSFLTRVPINRLIVQEAEHVLFVGDMFDQSLSRGV